MSVKCVWIHVVHLFVCVCVCVCVCEREREKLHRLPFSSYLQVIIELFASTTFTYSTL